MFTLTIKELAARKLRLLTTAFAVLLGVAFMAGTLVFTDTIRATYDSALAEANAAVDAYVRTPSDFELGYGEPGPRLDSSLADTVASVDGVDAAALRINGYAQVVGPDGTPVGDVSRAPAFGTNWATVDELNPYRLASGRAPSGDDEIVIDKASADEAGYEPGDVVTVLSKHEPRQFTISGIATFGDADSPAGATAVLFTDAVATELLAEPGQADAIAVTAEPGVEQDDLAARIQAAVGGDVEVVTGAELIRQEQDSLREDMAPMARIFVVFAFVAVLVGAFIINNTFSITVAQRTRTMAMLRAIGASGRQVKRSVLLEASVVGTVASAAGLVSGVAVAAGLRQLMSVLGFDMPDHPTVINAGAMAWSFALGVAVTVLSAWLPARRAARIAPMAALREVDVDRAAGSVRRAVLGSVITAGGVAALAAGLDGDMAFVGLGAIGLLAGAAVLAPVLVRPVAATFGLPLRAFGLRGELATRNAVRNPKRTARTAASLMIGVALVGFMTVFAASAKTSLGNSLDTDFTGTHIVHGGGSDNLSGLSPQLADELRSTPGVDVVTQLRITPAIVDGDTTTVLSGFDTSTVADMFRLGDLEGDVISLGTDGLAVSEQRAEEEGWSLGSLVPVTFPAGDTTLVVEAIYESGTDIVGPMFASLEALRANGGADLDQTVFVTGAESAITGVASSYGSADVLDKDGFLDSVSAEIDTMLMMFYALLMLAVLIALLGIANTLALSVFERTRELGLLRAIGMGRRQVRSTIRWESVIIAVFGTTLGVALGVVFGWAIVRVVGQDGLIDTLTIPVGNLAVVTAIAAVAGGIAAVVPARRATGLDVLEALGKE